MMHFGSIPCGGPVPFHVSSVVPRFRLYISLRQRQGVAILSINYGVAASFFIVWCWIGLMQSWRETTKVSLLPFRCQEVKAELRRQSFWRNQSSGLYRFERCMDYNNVLSE